MVSQHDAVRCGPHSCRTVHASSHEGNSSVDSPDKPFPLLVLLQGKAKDAHAEGKSYLQGASDKVRAL